MDPNVEDQATVVGSQRNDKSSSGCRLRSRGVDDQAVHLVVRGIPCAESNTSRETILRIGCVLPLTHVFGDLHSCFFGPLSRRKGRGIGRIHG